MVMTPVENSEPTDQVEVIPAEVEEAVEAVSQVGIGPLEDATESLAEEEALESPADAPVATAPVAEIPPAPSPAPVETTPPLDPQVREYIRRLEEVNRATQEKAELGLLQEAVDKYALQLEEQYGVAPEQAKIFATQRGQEIYQQYQAQQAAAREVRETQAKVFVAAQIADRYKVPIASLMQYASPTAMEMAAEATSKEKTTNERAAAWEKENAELKKENAELKKAYVPPGQRFETGRVGAGLKTGRTALLDRYLENPNSLTPQQKASLFPER